MQTAYLVLSIITFAASLVATLIIAVDACQYEWWAGMLVLLVPVYLIYWAIFEFEHERKWPIVVVSLGGVFFAALFFEQYVGVPVLRPHSFTGFR